METITLSENSVESIGEWIRRYRKQDGLTLEQLGDRLGISAQAVGEVERGRTGLTLERLNRILEALDVKGQLTLYRETDEAPTAGPTLDRLRLARDVADRILTDHERVIQAVYLYGSTAHGTAQPDSDLDLMVIVNTDSVEKQRLWTDFYESIQEVQMKSGIYVSLQVKTAQQWNKDRSNFKQEVTRRGVKLYGQAGGSRGTLEASA
ncbi:MAG: helix-turn-helix domain-containing protein [bacterium]